MSNNSEIDYNDINEHISYNEMLKFIHVSILDEESVPLVAYVNAHLIVCDQCRNKMNQLKIREGEPVKS